MDVENINYIPERKIYSRQEWWVDNWIDNQRFMKKQHINLYEIEEQ